MTDAVQAWLDERRRIQAGASTGRWEGRVYEGVPGYLSRIVSVAKAENRMEHDHVTSLADYATREDSVSIADAHNNLPHALAAIEAVMKLHEPHRVLVYEELRQYCIHCEKAGVWYEELSVPWPCSTVQAVLDALGVEEA